MASAEPKLIVEMDIKGMDFDALMEEFDEHVDEGMDKLADEIEQVWRDKATETLNTSREQYLKGLSVERIGRDIQMVLNGFLPVALEEGHERYDMKPGFLGSGLNRIIPIGKSSGQKPVFRMMRTDSTNWFHPGFEAKRIHEQVQEEVDERLVEEIFQPLFSTRSSV